MFKLIQHRNLKELDNVEIGWSFRHVSPTISPSTLETLSCLEVRIDGLGDDDTLINEASRRLDEFAWALVEYGIWRGYLVRSDRRLSPKSRLKSYKGLFRDAPEIRRGELCEYEIDKNGTSFFVGLAKLNKLNSRECCKFAREILRSFILLAELDTARSLWHELGDTLIDCLTIHNDVIVINYPRLIPTVVLSGRVVMTFGLDTRGEFVNVRLFIEDFYREEWLKRVERLQTYREDA